MQKISPPNTQLFGKECEIRKTSSGLDQLRNGETFYGQKKAILRYIMERWNRILHFSRPQNRAYNPIFTTKELLNTTVLLYKRWRIFPTFCIYKFYILSRGKSNYISLCPLSTRTKTPNTTKKTKNKWIFKSISGSFQLLLNNIYWLN